MKRKRMHRVLSSVCAAAIVMSAAASNLPTVFADTALDGSDINNEKYANHETLVPIPEGFSTENLMKWTPESDPDSRYNRSVVPLAQNRFQGPQVTEKANPDAKLMLCAISNSLHDVTPAQGSDSFINYAMGYWQYVDQYIDWGGSEEGMYVPPAPDIIDSAHRNGVPVLGTLFFNDKDKLTILQKEGDTFPVADKMIEMKNYYGFDGYFVNQEKGYSSAQANTFDEFLRYIHKKDPTILISFYESLNNNGNMQFIDQLNSSNNRWMRKDADGVAPADSMFINYNWGWSGTNPMNNNPDNYNKVPTTLKTLEELGRSPYDAYHGLDVQQFGMKTDFRDHVLLDENGVIKTSLAMFCPNSTIGFARNGAEFHEVEQEFFTGPEGDPTIHNLDPTEVPDPKREPQKNRTWVGLSRFLTDKSVITEAPFTTNFNTGHGAKWFVNGEASRHEEWNNRSVQDILPTWTWYTRSTTDDKLIGGYDFDDAYNGPNSVKFDGRLNGENTIMMYSTNLTDARQVQVTYKVNKPGSKVQVGLCYADNYDAENFKYFDLNTDNAVPGEWTTATVDVSADYGKLVSAVSFKVSGDVEDYKLNLGGLSVTDEQLPELNAPGFVKLDEILYKNASDAEARIYWGEVEGASYYEVYRVDAQGNDVLLNATPNNAYYFYSLPREAGQEKITVKVIPVDANGVRGQSKSMNVAWELPEDATGIPTGKDPGLDPEKNVCLSAEITGISGQGDAEPGWKALDGLLANGSKWCQDKAVSGYMDIKLQDVKTIKRLKVCHANAPGAEEGRTMNTVKFGLQYKDSADGEWKTAQYFDYTNPDATPSSPPEVKYALTEDVTDVVLDTPVTAQYFRLKIDQSVTQWTAIRIYEWQMFEDPTFPETDAVPMHYASAVNGAGATDSFTLTNVPEGQTVKLYASMDAETPIAGGSAVADETGVVSFDNVDFGNASAGRIYYTTTKEGAPESVKMSVSYDPEDAQKTPISENVRFGKFRAQSVDRVPGIVDESYSDIIVGGLQPGDVVSVYSNMDDALYTKRSIGVLEDTDSVKIERVKVSEGESLILQIKRQGMLASDRYEVECTTREEKLPDINAPQYEVTIGEMANGTVTADNMQAEKGDLVTLTVTPKDGYRLVAGSLKVNGEAIEGCTFQMPKDGAVVTAQFEKVPTFAVLEQIIAKAEQLLEDGALEGTMEAVVTEFNAALQAARNLVAAGADVTTQAEINDATVRLLSVMAKVDWKQGDKTVLQVAVDVANALRENLDLYLEPGKQNFLDALSEAEALLASGNAWDDDIKAATDALIEAMNNLRMTANKDILNDMIEKAQAIDLSKYTDESAAAVRAALEKAQALSARDTAAQTDVDEAAQSLKAAMEGLVLRNDGTVTPDGNGTNNGNGNGNAAGNNTVNGVGDGSAPTKTGDAGAASLVALMMLSAAGAALALGGKKRRG